MEAEDFVAAPKEFYCLSWTLLLVFLGESMYSLTTLLFDRCKPVVFVLRLEDGCLAWFGVLLVDSGLLDYFSCKLAVEGDCVMVFPPRRLGLASIPDFYC